MDPKSGPHFWDPSECSDGPKEPATALAGIVARLHADTGTIHWLGPDGLLHLIAATPGLPDHVLATIRTIPVGKGMAGLAVERMEPVTACNIQTDQSGDVRPGALATGLAGAIVELYGFRGLFDQNLSVLRSVRASLLPSPFALVHLTPSSLYPPMSLPRQPH